MPQANPGCDQLIRSFTEHHFGKLFYFCLKRTGHSAEAEDLMQDISVHVLSALNKGTVPSSFSAWVWQIARNRYSVWAANKHRRSDRVTGDPIDDYEIADTHAVPLDEMIHAEQLALIRRELSFIRSDYRNIVVAYYIKNRRIRDIASSLSLSESTVKSRLFRAREILKEGMNMAREFGKRSYNPEEITFTNSCSHFGDNGQPWSILSHAIYKNIFLEAYGNPSTAEELSLELGIALPYMEDELKFLTKQTFLVKCGNKYETSFPIIGKDVQEQVWNYNSSLTDKLAHLLEKLIDDYAAACTAHGVSFYGSHIGYEEAKWVLLMKAFDFFAYTDSRKIEYTKRPDNGRWDIVGYQIADIPHIPAVGLHGSASNFSQYQFKYKNIEEKKPYFLTDEEARTVQLAAEGKLAACDPAALNRLVSYGYIRKLDAGYALAIAVFEKDGEKKAMDTFTEAEKESLAHTAEEIRSIFAKSKEFSFKVTADSLPPLLRRDARMCHFACNQSMLDRNVVLDHALANGWLAYDEASAKILGAYLLI